MAHFPQPVEKEVPLFFFEPSPVTLNTFFFSSNTALRKSLLQFKSHISLHKILYKTGSWVVMQYFYDFFSGTHNIHVKFQSS